MLVSAMEENIIVNWSVPPLTFLAAISFSKLSSCVEEELHACDIININK